MEKKTSKQQEEFSGPSSDQLRDNKKNRPEQFTEFAEEFSEGPYGFAGSEPLEDKATE